MHLNSMNEEQLLKAIKPLLVHNNWEYLEEYFLREYNKQAHVGMRATELHDIFRSQGQCTALQKLGKLKSTVLGAS